LLVNLSIRMKIHSNHLLTPPLAGVLTIMLPMWGCSVMIQVKEVI